MTGDMLQTLSQWAPSFVAVVIAWLGGRASKRVKQIETESSPYEALAELVAALRARS